MTTTVQPVSVDVRPLHSVTVRYFADEDRIILALNAGTAQACGFWLTRRLVLRLIEQAQPFIERTSLMVAQAPTGYRSEVATIERQVAVASMQKSFSKTPQGVLAQTAGLAELATEMTISIAGPGFRMNIHARDGIQAAGSCTRAELQSIIHMIEQEVGKTGWNDAPVGLPAAQADATAAAAKRQAN